VSAGPIGTHLARRPSGATAPADDFAQRRARMVEGLRRRGIADAALLAAFAAVPRHLFVDEALSGRAYGDDALPIGHGQTLSQPFIAARMIEMLRLTRRDRVLEVGTGSGYQSALLSRVAGAVYSVERLPALAARARDNWERAGVAGINLMIGDGTLGWEARSPFDGIVVSAAAPSVPAPLLAQLGAGGRLVIPVGDAADQTLRRHERGDAGDRSEVAETCRFVPLIGAEGFAE
jgi:protein-L-isoaspartate(D-aspartate) O-methyltransferase